MPATGTVPSIALLRQAVTVAVAGMARSYERWSTPARVAPPIASGARLAIPRTADVLTLLRKSSAMLQNRCGRDALE